MPEKKSALIFGAGPVGTLLALYLHRRGYNCEVHDRRPDLRLSGKEDGRSINLALSERGLHALRQIIPEEEILQTGVPMYGRMMHDTEGATSYQPYGKDGQSIFSVSRNALNLRLLQHAGKKEGVNLHFESRCNDVNFETGEAVIQDKTTGESQTIQSDLIFGADGAYSAVRGAMTKAPRYEYIQHYIEHGYKEFNIPAGPNGTWRMERNALHIWPRGNFMMIALPNPDGSFTGTLFFPFEGPLSFAGLKNTEDVTAFFKKYFADLVPLIPDAASAFFDHPLGSLVTIRSGPWVRGNALLIGDAAHAIVPFYGQGLNAGFEDVYLLDKMAAEHNLDFAAVLRPFEQSRRPDTDAISELSMQNFIEMRDLVGDRTFLLRKKIEGRLNQLFPELWVPLYTQVTFSRNPYREALESGKEHDRIMEQLMALPDVEIHWQNDEWLAEAIFRFIGNPPELESVTA
ncbi:MAG: NAD(P)/FAD-dependent oxidoreductase [Bacteroidota bacterium]